eukprot:4755397-Karenia_brevis.AAC.1
MGGILRLMLASQNQRNQILRAFKKNINSDINFFSALKGIGSRYEMVSRAMLASTIDEKELLILKS